MIFMRRKEKKSVVGDILCCGRDFQIPSAGIHILAKYYFNERTDSNFTTKTLNNFIKINIRVIQLAPGIK